MNVLERLFGSAIPVCRACGYDLTGLKPEESKACPECGAGLEAANIGLVRRRPGRWVFALSVWGPGVLSALLFTALDQRGFDRPFGGVLLGAALGSLGLWMGAPVWYAQEFVSPPRRMAAVLWMAAVGVVGNFVLCVVAVNAAREIF